MLPQLPGAIGRVLREETGAPRANLCVIIVNVSFSLSKTVAALLAAAFVVLLLPGSDRVAASGNSGISVSAGIAGSLPPGPVERGALDVDSGGFAPGAVFDEPLPVPVICTIPPDALAPGSYRLVILREGGNANITVEHDFTVEAGQATRIESSITYETGASGMDGLKLACRILGNGRRTVWGPKGVEAAPTEPGGLYVLLAGFGEADIPAQPKEAPKLLALNAAMPGMLPANAHAYKDFAGIIVARAAWDELSDQVKTAMKASALFGVRLDVVNLDGGGSPDENGGAYIRMNNDETLAAALDWIRSNAAADAARLAGDAKDKVGSAKASEVANTILPTYAVDISPPVAPSKLDVRGLRTSIEDYLKAGGHPNLAYWIARYRFNRVNFLALPILHDRIDSEYGQARSFAALLSNMESPGILKSALAKTMLSTWLFVALTACAFQLRRKARLASAGIILCALVISLLAAKPPHAALSLSITEEDESLGVSLKEHVSYVVGNATVETKLEKGETLSGVSVLAVDNDLPWSFASIRENDSGAARAAVSTSFLSTTRVICSSFAAGTLPISLSATPSDDGSVVIRLASKADKELANVYVGYKDRIFGVGTLSPGDDIQFRVTPAAPGASWRTVITVQSQQDPLVMALGILYRGRGGNLVSKERDDGGPHVYGLAVPRKGLGAIDVLRQLGEGGTLFDQMDRGAPWLVAGADDESGRLAVIVHFGKELGDE